MTPEQIAELKRRANRGFRCERETAASMVCRWCRCVMDMRRPCRDQVMEATQQIPALIAAWERAEAAEQRLSYLLDQLSPSMFPDHGIANLRCIADNMRAAGASGRGAAGIESIDRALTKPGTPLWALQIARKERP